jgi:outer membrane protein W
MKKLLLISALICAGFIANAQSTTYKAFKVDIDFGYAIPSAGNGTGTKAGATFTIEPHYRLSDDLAVGLRFEGAGLGYEEDNGNGGTKVKVSILSSYCPTLEYYFAKGGFRPFGGVGLGVFSQQSVTKSNSGNGATLVPGASNFGFFPRLGFETGHLRVSATYDIAGNNSNYVAFTLGFFFGGGKK